MELAKGIIDRIRNVKDKAIPSKAAVLSALSRSAGKIPFADDVMAMWYCAMDPTTPPKVKAAIIGALAYLVLPMDTIPDVVVGLGFTDDITVITAVLAIVTAYIKQEHKDRAAAALSKNDVSDESMPIRPVD